MTIGLTLGGPAAEAAARVVSDLVGAHIASAVTALDSTLWGPAAGPDADARRALRAPEGAAVLAHHGPPVPRAHLTALSAGGAVLRAAVAR